MKASILLLLSCTLYIQAVQSDSPCNDYVDGVINDLKEDKEYMQDPYAIPTKSIEFHLKPAFINYTGEASIYDGFIFGLSSLHRDGDVIVDRKKNVHLKIYLGAGELKLQCKGKVKLMGHGPEARINAKVSYINMKLDIVPTENGTNPKISNFNIEDVKGIEVKVSGLGPLNFMTNQFIKFVGTFFKNIVRNRVESKLTAFMDKKLKKYVVPEECLGSSFK